MFLTIFLRLRGNMTFSSEVVEWAGQRARGFVSQPLVPVTSAVSVGGAAWAVFRHVPFSAPELRTLVELSIKLAQVGVGGRVCLSVLLLVVVAPIIFWVRDQTSVVRRELLDLSCDWVLQVVGVLVVGPAWFVAWRAINFLYFK